MVDMEITNDEIITILESMIDRRYWETIDFDLVVSRATDFESGEGIVGKKFECGMVDLLLEPNGNFYDAHPHS